MFNAVEINSSFYRPHKRTTYQRWAANVPGDFAFAVKLPKAITHAARLAVDAEPVERFLEDSGGLGAKRGPVLIQLPPSLAFDAAVAGAFFSLLRDRTDGALVCEPRHRSWFTAEANKMLVGYRIARVAADPAPTPEASEPGGWQGVYYARLHGSPDIYRSNYDAGTIARHADAARVADGESWTIFDNTMTGAATLNALSMREAIMTASRSPR